MIKGTEIRLYNNYKTNEIGEKYLGTSDGIIIEDVIIGQPSADSQPSSFNIEGVAIDYVLGIPKKCEEEIKQGDFIGFFGQRFRVIGVVQGIEENIPLRWHRKVYVVRYE